MLRSEPQEAGDPAIPGTCYVSPAADSCGQAGHDAREVSWL
jgi:hypothetical protein